MSKEKMVGIIGYTPETKRQNGRSSGLRVMPLDWMEISGQAPIGLEGSKNGRTYPLEALFVNWHMIPDSYINTLYNDGINIGEIRPFNDFDIAKYLTPRKIKLDINHSEVYGFDTPRFSNSAIMCKLISSWIKGLANTIESNPEKANARAMAEHIKFHINDLYTIHGEPKCYEYIEHYLGMCKDLAYGLIHKKAELEISDAGELIYVCKIPVKKNVVSITIKAGEENY